MDYSDFIRPLKTPAGYTAPTQLRFDGLTARALTRADVVADTHAVNASIDLIQRTRGGDWPTGPISEEFDYVDLVWHECEFRENYSFAYAVHDAEGRQVGCCYLYPMGRRTPLRADLLQHDVDVSWWVTPDAYGRGLYATLHRALQRWVVTEFPFTNPHFSNREIPLPR